MFRVLRFICCFIAFIIIFWTDYQCVPLFLLCRNTACNSIKGATEGIIYPTHLDKDAIFRVYRKAFCRPLPIKFRKEVWTEYGLPGYYYTLTDNFADPPESNPDNECYCHDKKKCLKKGLVDLTPCYYSTYSISI